MGLGSHLIFRGILPPPYYQAWLRSKGSAGSYARALIGHLSSVIFFSPTNTVLPNELMNQCTRKHINAAKRELLTLVDAAIQATDHEGFARAMAEVRHRKKRITVAEADRLSRQVLGRGLFEVPWIEGAIDAAKKTKCADANTGDQNLYAVLLRDDASDKMGIYVGKTFHPIEKRFQQHKSGTKSSRHVKNHGVALLRVLTSHLQDLPRPDAEQLEADLAAAFDEIGIWTEGGH